NCDLPVIAKYYDVQTAEGHKRPQGIQLPKGTNGPQLIGDHVFFPYIYRIHHHKNSRYGYYAHPSPLSFQSDNDRPHEFTGHPTTDVLQSVEPGLYLYDLQCTQ